MENLFETWKNRKTTFQKRLKSWNIFFSQLKICFFSKSEHFQEKLNKDSYFFWTFSFLLLRNFIFHTHHNRHKTSAKKSVENNVSLLLWAKGATRKWTQTAARKRHGPTNKIWFWFWSLSIRLLITTCIFNHVSFEEKVLEFIRKNQPCTRSQVKHKTGITSTEIS